MTQAGEMSGTRSRRILVATHAPALTTFGAGQMALNLADALRRRGHVVDVWCPPVNMQPAPWWQSHRAMRRALGSYLAGEASYDVIDAPPFLIAADSRRGTTVIARSVQPDLRYLWSEWRHFVGTCDVHSAVRHAAEVMARAAYAIHVAWLTLRGWAGADRILCLGTLELAWMRRAFPWWRGKLQWYVSALGDAERAELLDVRRKRTSPGTSLRMLWIGRWTAHKGTARLAEFIERWVVARPSDTFTIAGCGVPRDSRLRRLAQLPQVTILERFERTSLPAVLSSHDVGLFTSDVEGWGLVINEMIEAGMPVYATRTGAVPDVEQHARGLRPFPPCPRTIAGGIGDVSVDDEYHRRFNWDAIARQYEASLIGTGTVCT